MWQVRRTRLAISILSISPGRPRRRVPYSEYRLASRPPRPRSRTRLRTGRTEDLRTRMLIALSTSVKMVRLDERTPSVGSAVRPPPRTTRRPPPFRCVCRTRPVALPGCDERTERVSPSWGRRLQTADFVDQTNDRRARPARSRGRQDAFVAMQHLPGCSAREALEQRVG